MSRKTKRGGVAMMLVVVLMAAAAIMGFALLSSASNQAQAGSNSTSAVDAEALTQSGTNLALYYLMYPEKADAVDLVTSNGVTFYNPGTRIPAMKLSSGSAVSSINVTANNSKNFTVNVTATATRNGASITRTRRSEVQLTTRYVPRYAMAARDSFTMPLTFLTTSVNGPVRCDGGYGGLLSAVAGIIFGTTANQPIPSIPSQACPQYSDLTLPKKLGNGTYEFNGVTYSCKALAAGTLTSASFTLTGPQAAANPGSVFYADNDITLSGTITLNGTLVVKDSRTLTIAGNAVTITAKQGYPALIAGRDIAFNGSGRKLTVNGVCWMGGNLTGSGVLPSGTFAVNGSLMWGGSNPKIDTTKLLGLTSRMIVAWPTGASTLDPGTPDSIYVPELTDKDNTPKTVKVVSSSVN